MRTKNAIINAMGSIITFILSFIPVFIVRKVFLDVLGEELLGLSSLYSNIISYLSLIEMGIGTVIIFSLYKPFSEKNIFKINGYINYYAKFYRIVGIIIFILGILITPFLSFFITDTLNIKSAQWYFFLFLLNTLISYFFTYRFCLLNVSQEGYKLAIGTCISKIIIASLQIFIIYKYQSFSLYLLTQIIINLIFYLILNIYINKHFSWLGNKTGTLDEKEKKQLDKNIKSLFFHKIGSIIVFGTDSIVISSFINLATVAKYNSYYLITSSLQSIVKYLMNSMDLYSF